MSAVAALPAVEVMAGVGRANCSSPQRTERLWPEYHGRRSNGSEGASRPVFTRRRENTGAPADAWIFAPLDAGRYARSVSISVTYAE